MIILIEGPRHSGKTFLIQNFLSINKNENLEYYKFYFANHVKELGLSKLDSEKSLHYLSLGNILTILEMNKSYEKIKIFDRSILSAYTWAILQKRLSKKEAIEEFKRVIGSSLFCNCRHLVIEVEGETKDKIREKDDLWKALHHTQTELEIMNELIEIGYSELTDQTKGNYLIKIKNNFDYESANIFNSACNSFINQYK